MTPPFHVDCPKGVLVRFHQDFSRLSSPGEKQKAFRALKDIFHRLETNPFQFGEPLFHLRTMNLMVRIGTILSLSVIYAVHSLEPNVFVQKITISEGTD